MYGSEVIAIGDWRWFEQSFNAEHLTKLECELSIICRKARYTARHAWLPFCSSSGIQSITAVGSPAALFPIQGVLHMRRVSLLLMILGVAGTSNLRGQQPSDQSASDSAIR